MLIDARRLPPGTVLEADVCIVGAGAAGIALGLQAAAHGLGVLILEGGGLRRDRFADELLAGESGGLPYELSGTREVGLGGTTRTWCGWCRPLDPIDLEPRPVLRHGGWPVSAEELLPFYRRAHDSCGAGPFEYGPEALGAPDRPLLPVDAARVQTRVWRFATRPRFADAHGQVLRASPAIRVALHAWAVEILTDEAARTVREIRAASVDGHGLVARARAYVLAAGGIENARLLLDSGPRRAGGVGNGRDLVGRFFAEHPYVNAAVVTLADPRRVPRFYLRHRSGGWPVQGVLTLADELVRREGLVRCAVFFLPPHQSHRDYVAAATAAARGAGRAARTGRWPSRPRKIEGRAVADLRPLGATAVRALVGARRARTLVARAFLESAPNPASRVLLTGTRDRLGRLLPRIEWRLTDLERPTLRRTLEVVGQELERCGVGRLTPLADDPELGWPPGLRGGRHHMGSTRMSDDPASGVVDRHGRVHGIDNLHVAGSSIFPSSGLANPTLTILALSLRLADRLRDVVRERAA